MLDEERLKNEVTRMRLAPRELEWFEFKLNNANPEVIGKSLCAVHNGAQKCDEPYGYIVFGIDDKTHRAVGTELKVERLMVGSQPIDFWLSRQLDFAVVELTSMTYEGAQVIVISIRAGATRPLTFGGRYYLRVGGAIADVTTKQEQLQQLLGISRHVVPYEQRVAMTMPASGRELFDVLDRRAVELIVPRYASQPAAESIDQLVAARVLVQTTEGLGITNLGLLLFARNLNEHLEHRDKRVRIIHYSGTDKSDGEAYEGGLGYVRSLGGIMEQLTKILPRQPASLEGAQLIRRPVYPERSLREIVANALIHQDLEVNGINPTLSVFADRIEIRNAGLPQLDVDRWIDEDRTRNQGLADAMLAARLCERRGSGIDKALLAIEAHHLPAPRLVLGDQSTTVILYGPRHFRDMDKHDRIRVCYQHTCLQFVANQRCTNTSLRTRLGLAKEKHTTVSGIFADALADGWILEADPLAGRKYVSYVPYWVRGGRERPVRMDG